MAQQNPTAGAVALSGPDPSSTHPPSESAFDHVPVAPDILSIFSAPALEVVFRWWHESNRRWAERATASRTEG